VPPPAKSCFLHVPKTGGSWLSAAIRTTLPAHEFYEVPSERIGHVPVALLLDRFTVVAGHFTVAHLTHVLNDAFTFTLLRDPVDRVVSLYHFYRQQIPTPQQDPRVAQAQALDFETFVARLQDRVSPWSNWQTFVFSGAVDCETPANELLPAALANLDRINFVGVQDELRDGLSALAALRGWQVTAPPERLNASRKRPSLCELKPSVVEKLQVVNEVDLELFRRARERWASIRQSNGAITPSPSIGRTSSPTQPVEMGTKQIVITRVDADARRGVVVVRAQSFVTARNVTVGIRITDAAGLVIYGVNTWLLGRQISVTAGSVFDVVFRLNLELAPGEYHLTAAIHEGADHLERCYHWIDRVTRFVCHATHDTPFAGFVDLHATAETRVVAEVV
jgi:hypothetical protein